VIQAVTTVWNKVINFGETVGNIVDQVTKESKPIANGDYDYEHDIKLAEINWNFESGAAKDLNIFVGDYGICKSCFLHFDIGIHVDLHIQDHTLLSTACYMDGKFQTQIDAVVKASASKDLDYHVPLAKIHLKPISFMIGSVTMVIDTTVPIQAGVTAQASFDGNVHASAAATSSVKYGIMYTKYGNFQFIHEHNYSHSGSLETQNIPQNMSLSTTLYLLPTVVINIDHIGGPNVGLKGWVEPSFIYSAPSESCGKELPKPPFNGPGTGFSVNW
jgi:hypothetical protein